jgi:hypothetical protein
MIGSFALKKMQRGATSFGDEDKDDKTAKAIGSNTGHPPHREETNITSS